ncbi:MAG: ATP-dependent RNA helicase HrpA [Planctomycetota bacterium]
MPPLDQFESEILQAMFADRHRLRNVLRGIQAAARDGKPLDRQRMARLEKELQQSAGRCQARRKAVPKVTFDPELPISARREDIAAAIRDHQVVIVCGETGSGKSTQLPKICLNMGRGVAGLIGHTQPRRIAARSVAARIAEEIGSPLGRDVGYKVRFSESLGPQSYIKLMTDGILLAETQSDPDFSQYDTIILDEAHERSLNVDFLIGYLKRLLPKRPDLRLIITSATIDAARFAEHFSTTAGPAPVVEVSGRAYPIKVFWRPMEPDEDGNDPDLQDAVRAAVEEVARIDRGDMLIFMPTERDIHETAKTLRSRPLPGDATGQETEILPLYARLSIQEQQHVFHPGPKRRIVIATNVAESSLTVPRIRFVIDPGTARISRYSPRSKTQRLPIEAVAQASADQRKGRCGRVGPGICVRLFSEEDFLGRDRFTMPEIQRTNLASVILQMKALRLGELEDFPLIDPPKTDAIRDGYRTLFELGATDEQQELTEIGRRLSRLPVDPRIGRMILAAIEEGCLHEMLIIASALEVQDPRERPVEKQEAADKAHAQFADEQSDFLSYLKIWDFYHKLKNTLSRNQLQKACRQNFLSFMRLREWLDVHRELLEEEGVKGEKGEKGVKGEKEEKGDKGNGRRLTNSGVRQLATDNRKPTTSHPKYDNLHRAILAGLLSSVATRGDGHDYNVAGGGKANLWPGSGMFRSKAKWIVAAEQVETTRRYLRCCGRIDPRWIEPLAEHLIKRTYSDLHWESKWASAVALERLTLFGLVVVAGRLVRYGPIDADASRQLLIEHGLVQGDLEPKPALLVHNEELLDEVQQLQAKVRRRDIVISEWERFAFYDQRLPAEIYDGAQLARWLRESPENARQITMSKADLLREGNDVAEDAFPDQLVTGSWDLPLDYQFEPGQPHDGVTVIVPLEALNQVQAEPLAWLVPGHLEEKVLAMIRSLPKTLRTRFVPAPEAAKRAMAELRYGEGNLRAQLARVLSRIGGVAVSAKDFAEERLPPELQMNVRVTDFEGQTLATSRDLDALRRQLGTAAAEAFTVIDDPCWNRDGLTTWDFDELPTEIDVSHGRLARKAYPALVDGQTSVSLRLLDSPQRAAYKTRFALRRLFLLVAWREVKTQVDWLPGLDKAPPAATLISGFDLRQQLAELLAVRAWPDEVELPRSKAAFETALSVARQRIGLAVQDLAGVIGPWFDAYREAHTAFDVITNLPSPSGKGAGGEGGSPATWGKLVFSPLPLGEGQGVRVKWQYAIDDIREQFASLAGPNCLSTTPWTWLRHCPRYFRAIRVRLDALAGGGIAKDRERFEEFLPRWHAYLKWIEQHGLQYEHDPELIQYRWMLEEYRVSLFAQKLGTSIPVSPKRLEQQWSKVKE